MRLLDLAVILAYLVETTAFGAWVSRSCLLLGTFTCASQAAATAGVTAGVFVMLAVKLRTMVSCSGTCSSARS
jgi:hypothetical protein